MACNRSNEIPNLSLDEETYLSQQLSPQSRPADFFNRPSDPTDPLAANWSYDSTIDMFALNPTDMSPVSFDFADNLTNLDSKDLFADPFTGSSGISGFSMPMAEDAASLSSVCDLCNLNPDHTNQTSYRSLTATISLGSLWLPASLSTQMLLRCRPVSQPASPRPDQRSRPDHQQDGHQAQSSSKKMSPLLNLPRPQPPHPARPAVSPKSPTDHPVVRTRRCGMPPSVPPTTSSRNVTAPT